MEPVFILMLASGVMFTTGFFWATQWYPALRKRRRQKRIANAPIPDPRRWLREERRKEMQEWDKAFIQLGGDSSLEWRAAHLRKIARREDIMAMQQKAIEAGYYNGMPDGEPGPEFIKALQRMAKDRRLHGDVTEVRTFRGDVMRHYEDPRDPRGWV